MIHLLTLDCLNKRSFFCCAFVLRFVLLRFRLNKGWPTLLRFPLTVREVIPEAHPVVGRPSAPPISQPWSRVSLLEKRRRSKRLGLGRVRDVNSLNNTTNEPGQTRVSYLQDISKVGGGVIIPPSTKLPSQRQSSSRQVLQTSIPTPVMSFP